MLLTITHSGPDAGDLGFLLHKNPANVHRAKLPFGEATVFYPEASAERCTACLLVDVNPVALVRSKGARQGGWALGQYVNDRPYAASSFLSTAISRVFGTAMNGNCQKRPELPARELELRAGLPVLPAPGGGERLRRLFEPLGYEVEAEGGLLDGNFPEWGESPYQSVVLRKRATLSEMLRHLYVLIPVLDRWKHYWVGPAEIEKLLDKGEGWLEEHPERDWITARYLKYRRNLTREALERLVPEDGEDEEVEAGEDLEEEGDSPEEPEAEGKVSLHTKRLDRVTELVKSLAPESVADLGCGEGKLLVRLLDRTRVPRITGMDVSSRSLEIARERLERRLRGNKLSRLTLLHGSLIYRDSRLAGHQVVTLVEVIEHLDPCRLESLEKVVFGSLRPAEVIVTTPNIEYNVLFEGMEAGQLRHGDHRFEWTRAEFRGWAERLCEEHGYTARFEPLGEEDPERGAPSQLARFSLSSA